jgi:ribosomal protein S18 acetylase RimI-like enzyme
MAEQLAVRHGKARMDLATAKSNRAAQAVYRSMGWTRDELFYTYNKRIEVSGRQISAARIALNTILRNA